MRLEDITAEVRPRGRWEAVDLGFALARRHFGRLLAAWVLCVGPLWALLLWSSQWIGVGWTIFAIWWLKPLYERLPVFILSRALFGATPKLREIVRAWPRLLASNLWYSLVTTRITGTRALLMPVSMLEGLRGAERKARSKVLIRHSGGCAGSLTFVCFIYEMILAISIATLIGLFIPGDGASAWVQGLVDAGFTQGMPRSLLWLSAICWLGAITLVGLFYAGAGFGLYLNVRTHLEGWDVEIAFRRLGTRLAGALAAILFLLSLGAAHGQELEATTPQEQTTAQNEIGRILRHEDFKIHKTETWVQKSSPLNGPSVPGGVFEVLGTLLFWAAVVALVVMLIRFIIKYRHTLRGGDAGPGKIAAAPARAVAGLDVTPESLPADIVAAARQRWLAGDAPGALSLLYRGSLSWLIHRLELPIADSDTEGDCLRRAAAISEPRARDYFTHLTGRWVAAAYAGQDPAAPEMEALLETWPYDARSGGAAR